MNRWADAIRRLRRQSDLSVETLASFAGLYPERLRDLERGAHHHSHELQAIACVFGLELRELLQTDPASPLPTLLFREREALGLSADLWRQHNALLLGRFQRCVNRLEALEPRSAEHVLDRHVRPIPPSHDTTAQGIELAHSLREALKLHPTEPVWSVRKLMDWLGVAIFALDDPDDTLEGLDAACTHTPRPAILLNLASPPSNDPERLEQQRSPWWRVRMTLAHELAHLLFDRDELGGSLQISPRHVTRSTRMEQLERRANAFAANLLVPPDGVRQHLRGLDDPSSEEGIHRIQATYGVGRSVAIYRICDVLYPGESGVQRRMEQRRKSTRPLKLTTEFWIDGPLDFDCGLPGGPLLHAVLRLRRAEKLSSIRARELLDLQLTDWLPDGGGLTEDQRRPVISERDLAQRYILYHLAMVHPEESFALLHGTPTEQGGWCFDLYRHHAEDAPGRRVGRVELPQLDPDRAPEIQWEAPSAPR